MNESPTEEPSPRKLERARREGSVVRSPELGAAVVVLGAVGLLSFGGARALAGVRALFAATFDAVGSGAPDPLTFLPIALRTLGLALAPTLLGLFALSMVVAALQIGPRFGARWSPRAVRPGVAERVRGWWSGRAMGELGWSSLALAAVAAVAGFTLASGATGLAALPTAGSAHALASLSSFGLELMLRVGLVLACLGLASIAPRYLALRRSLRMGRHELREEQREQYGHPELRERRRRLHLEAAYQAALWDLEQAALVVVGGGTRVTGLALPDAAPAPVVAARAEGELGRRLLARAHALGIATTHAPALSRRLAHLELGEAIPPDCIATVARLWPPGARDATP